MTVGHWDGQKWSSGESLIPQSASFSRIAMLSASNGWAIGSIDNLPAIFHWDGVRWSSVGDQAGGSSPAPRTVRR